jgi:hypothetical protein
VQGARLALAAFRLRPGGEISRSKKPFVFAVASAVVRTKGSYYRDKYNLWAAGTLAKVVEDTKATLDGITNHLPAATAAPYSRPAC